MGKKYIRSEKMKIEDIVSELYDFSKPGIISIQDVLTAEAIEDLVRATRLNYHLFMEVPRHEGAAEQEMYTLYLDKVRKFQLAIESLPILDQFIVEYKEIYKKIAQEAQFDEYDFNKIGFHKYQAGSLGITPHQDYESHINLISMFNLFGDAKFYYCENVDKRNSKELDTNPGSLILLRAARNENEEQYRPYHYIDPMKTERLSINVRKKKYKTQGDLKLSK